MPDAPPLKVIIEQAIVKGWTRDRVDHAVAEYCKKEGLPGYTAAEINAAYAALVHDWITSANDDDETIYAWHIRARDYLYQQCVRLNDFKTALACAKDKAELQQQYKRAKAAKDKAPQREATAAKIRALAGQSPPDLKPVP